MNLFTAIISWCFFVTLSLTGKLCTGETESPTCGLSFNDSSGHIHYSNGSSITVPENISCTWKIESKANKSVFLVFEHLYLLDGDEIRISADGKDLDFFNPINLTNVVDALPCITGRSTINVTLTTTKVATQPFRTFVMYYYTNYTEYVHTFEPTKSGQIQSPLYDPSKISVPTDVHLKVSVPDKETQKLNLWFEKFMFTTGKLNVSGDSAHDGVYNVSNFPSIEFLANDILDLKLTIANGSKVSDVFVARYDSVTKVCSDDLKIPGTGGASVLSPSAEVLKYLRANKDMEMICHWLVETDSGKTLTISNISAILPGAMDQLLILDGPNRSSPVLFDMNNRTSDKLQGIFSTGNYLLISASAPSVSKDFMLDIQVNQTGCGGHMKQKGKVNAHDEDRSVFLLEVDPDKQVQLNLENMTLAEGASISFYKDFLSNSKPFLTMTSKNSLPSVGSPTEQMAVVTSGFQKSVLDASFLGIEKGCFAYGDNSAGTFSVSGHCNRRCGWMIEPKSADTGLLAFHFQTVNLLDSDRMIIRGMDASQTLIANLSSPTSSLPDLWLPAEMGAFVQVTRLNCTSTSAMLQTNYQAIPKCAATYSPGLRETVAVSSAGYPNHYPLGDSCTWNISKPNGSVFLHTSFNDLQLARDDHILALYEVINGTKLNLVFTANGTTKVLPVDMLIRGDLMINFTAKAETPFHSLPGFNLTVTAVEIGDKLVNSSGKIQTPGFPKPVNSSALDVWLVQVDTTSTQEQIVEYSFTNGTDLTELDRYLKVYDGATLRSGVITNFTSPPLLSRTNQLLFVYTSNGSTSAPGFSVSYSNHSCNMTLMCDNKICMHEDWKCNGINDCGDFSDEKYCQGGPAPTPQPAPPTPSPSDGSKGVSTAALAVGILIALVIGAILGIGAPAAFKRLRNNRFQNYSSFTNNIE